MKNPTNMDNRIASTLAVVCYGFALTAVGAVAYVMMTLAAHLSIGQGFYFTTAQF